VWAFVAAPAVIATIDAPGVSRADVCNSVGGLHVDVSAYGDTVANALNDAPPPDEAPPSLPAPDMTACADVGGGRASIGGCA
jgi:hypothetical protein